MNAYLPVAALFPFRYAALRRVRTSLSEYVTSGRRMFNLPWKELIADIAVWLVIGCLIAGIYYGFYDPNPTSGPHILIGCAALGIFAGILSFLRTEKLVIQALAEAPVQNPPLSSFFTVSRKMVLLIVVMLCMMALAICLMVWLDVWYLIENRDQPTPALYWGVFKEIAFALAILLSISLVILRRYSDNLRSTLEIQLAAMTEISRGNLDKQVPVLSSDEFAQYARQTNAMIAGLQEREICKTSFEKYVSPEISRKILDEGIAPEGDILDVTILFCDLRGYTSFVEQRNPHEVVVFMNQYFSVMERIVRDHSGVVLQYIGDEIEAVFGAPVKVEAHADLAVDAALEMRKALARINAQRTEKGKSTVAHGIGIHTGTVLAGNVGSSERMVYAMVGDTVNVASRLQVLNKTCGTDILISRGTLDRLGKTQKSFRSLGRHAIRGKREKVEVLTID